jgi:hypothetical protein
MRVLTHLRHNVIAYLALSIALGGTSYAAVQIPKDAVDSRAIAADAVGHSELAPDAVRSSDVKDGSLRAADFHAGELPAASTTVPAVSANTNAPVTVDGAHFVQVDIHDEAFDIADMHSTTTADDRLRIPQTGTYVLNGEVDWAPSADGYRVLEINQVNHGGGVLGSTSVEPRHSTIQSTTQQATAIVRLEAGTTVGLLAGQGSSSPVELRRGTLSAAFVGP